jgi:hypothetical protein
MLCFSSFYFGAYTAHFSYGARIWRSVYILGIFFRRFFFFRFLMKSENGFQLGRASICVCGIWAKGFWQNV